MTRPRAFVRLVIAPIAATLLGVAGLHAQTASGQYEPKVGQAGKDVVWVPNPPEMVERMLDLAQVTPRDLVVDLGSGDGRNVIAAARRGARALGVEYNPDLVELSRRHATEAGVAEKATFIQGDMYEADFSEATVLALFLLPQNLQKLMSKFLELKPGTRIVANTFGLAGWTPEATTRLEEGCRSWCEAMLYIVPARVEGTWRLPDGTLDLRQEYQKIAGAVTTDGPAVPIEDAMLRGDAISFSVADVIYTGRVEGDRIDFVKSGQHEQRVTATRQAK